MLIKIKTLASWNVIFRGILSSLHIIFFLLSLLSNNLRNSLKKKKNSCRKFPLWTVRNLDFPIFTEFKHHKPIFLPVYPWEITFHIWNLWAKETHRSEWNKRCGGCSRGVTGNIPYNQHRMQNLIKTVLPLWLPIKSRSEIFRNLQIKFLKYPCLV